MTIEDIPEDLVITCADIIRSGYCGRGQREWARLNGIDFPDFVKNGISARTLYATGDTFAQQVVTDKIERLGD